jgi:hypothetical protein
MFCPQCEAEYRPGFTRCSDCDVDLVEELPQETAQQVEALRIVWEGDSESDCVDVCRELQDAGIEYKVSQLPKSRYIKMVVYWRYKIGVPTSYYQKAKEVLGIDERSTEKRDQGV